MKKEQTKASTIDTESYTSTSGCTYQTTTSTSYFNSCPHRLPCGYCRLLMQDCPKNNMRLTW